MEKETDIEDGHISSQHSLMYAGDDVILGHVCDGVCVFVSLDGEEETP